MRGIIKTFTLSLFPCILCACGASRHIIPTATETKSVEVREKTVFVSDTVYIEIPSQTSERVVRDTISCLSNDFASSTAKVFSDGSLYHDLQTRPQRRSVPTQRQIEYRDSVVYLDKVVEVPKLIPRELTKWQKMQISGFRILLPIVLLLIVWIFRKPVLALVRRFI